MKKQDYIQPAMRVVKLQQQRMLCGSPYNNQRSVSTYDDDEDAITDKGSVW
jgi:hypothetical protein